MEINVQIRAGTASALSELESSPEADSLRSDLEELGVVLRPVHPKAEDPLLAPYFVVEVGDDEEVKERALAVLRESPLVEAAYVKPPAELP